MTDQDSMQAHIGKTTQFGVIPVFISKGRR